MPVIRIANDQLGMALHPLLHARMCAFAEKYTPELPGEPFVRDWLNGLYNDNPAVHILVELDAHNMIVAHALFTVKQLFGHYSVECHQLQVDQPSIALVDEVVEYGRKLRASIIAQGFKCCIAFTITKNVKAYEQRYGFKVARAVMMDYGDESDTVDAYSSMDDV